MKKRNFLAVLASCAVVVSMFPMTAGAANYDSSVEVENTAKIEKYLVMKTEANVPNASFEFTIAHGEALATQDGKMEVLAGVGTPKFVAADGNSETGTIEFTSADATEAETDAGERTVKFATTGEGNTTDEKFATKTMDIDFSGVPFTEPGIYRYIITEKEQTVTGVTNDTETTRTLDVYVVDASDETGRKLKVDSYVIHTGTDVPDRNADDSEGGYKEAGEKLENKSTGFTNYYSTQNLEFGKEVTGNQGSRDKYFEFTLTVGNAAGTTFDVVMDTEVKTPVKNDATTYSQEDMTAANTIDENDVIDGQQVVVDSTGTVTKKFYLNDGQYIKIVGLPQGAVYSITENAEDYQSKDGTDKVWQAEVADTEHPENNQPAKTYSDNTSGTIGTADIHTGYTNNRSGTIPTGVILSVAAPVVIGLAVLGGIVFLVIRNKKRDAEEEE